MKRFPNTGASIATPLLGEDELRRALGQLGCAGVYSDTEVHDLYLKLAQIHGTWWSEKAAKQSSDVAGALRRTGKNLIEAAALLSGHDSGLHTHTAIEATSQTASILALDPTVGSLEAADELIRTFKRNAERVGHACLIAYADLASEGSKGAAIPFYGMTISPLCCCRLGRKLGLSPS
jgi:hypothetical protein